MDVRYAVNAGIPLVSGVSSSIAAGTGAISSSLMSLADVRRFPTSKFEWFKGENLKKLLADAGIEYVHLEGLGGYRSGGYRKHMKSEVFREAFKELLKLVKGNKVAIFCSEKLFFKCHRRFIADELTRKGVKVIHVVEKGKTRVHRFAGHD